MGAPGGTKPVAQDVDSARTTDDVPGASPPTTPPPPSPPPPTQQNSTFPPPPPISRPSVRPSVDCSPFCSVTHRCGGARACLARPVASSSFVRFVPPPPAQIHNSFKCIAFPPFRNHSHSFNSFVVVVIYSHSDSDQFVVVAPLLLLCWW
ncbi:hypothetical protein niasHT_031066 [Heterodera trifolii]|uniref:Uncharacterized protein n=1 Tax=Heterodera trifolii TaxID=157864 RepID=A0ABD2I339_9BILA